MGYKDIEKHARSAIGYIEDMLKEYERLEDEYTSLGANLDDARQEIKDLNAELDKLR